jgi:transposase
VKKKRALRRYFKRLERRAAVLFEDETDLVFFPPLRAAWALRGQVARVRISGYNARRVFYGTINVRTGHRLWMSQARQRALEFQEFLKCIRNHYHGRHVILFLDEDSSHTAKASIACAAALDIKLCWLPVRCPELNPLERIWHYCKARRCANRQYASIDDQIKSFTSEMENMTNYQALITSGILSGNFWLFR